VAAGGVPLAGVVPAAQDTHKTLLAEIRMAWEMEARGDSAVEVVAEQTVLPVQLAGLVEEPVQQAA
jgi:hypothetical protein